MQVVINIPEEMYIDILNSPILDLGYFIPMYEAIQSGTPLPKGHGRLGDLDEIAKTHNGSNWDLHKILKNASTIIEADKGEEDADNN